MNENFSHGEDTQKQKCLKLFLKSLIFFKINFGLFLRKKSIIILARKLKLYFFGNLNFRAKTHTIRNLHFLSKNSTLISLENCRFFRWKTRENVLVLDFLAFDNFSFTRKIVKKIGGKTRENVVVLNFLVVNNFDFTRKTVKKNLDEKLVKM